MSLNLSFRSVVNFLVVKPASYLAGRIGGQAAVSQVQQVVDASVQRELDAIKPRVYAVIDTATVGAKAVAGDAIAFVRGRIVAGVDGLALSGSTQARVIAAVVGASAPKAEEIADAAADTLIEAFAAKVKTAVEAL